MPESVRTKFVFFPTNTIPSLFVSDTPPIPSKVFFPSFHSAPPGHGQNPSPLRRNSSTQPSANTSHAKEVTAGTTPVVAEEAVVATATTGAEDRVTAGATTGAEDRAEEAVISKGVAVAALISSARKSPPPRE